jgi:Ca2+-binding EF-hand superfamily protein
MVGSVSSAQCQASYGAQGMQGAQGKQALQEKLFSKLDADGNGSIDKSELNNFMSFVSSAQGTQATDSSQLFSKLDTDGDGAVSQSELADGAKSLFQELRSQLITASSATSQAPTVDQTQLDNLFSKMDANSDGSVSKDELGSFMSQNPPPAPPEGGHHGHGMHGGGGLLGKLNSLLDQYRTTAASTVSTGSSDDAADTGLSIAA